MPKIGFACKWIDNPSQINGLKAKDSAKQYNTMTTTLAWLNRQSKSIAEQKLWDIMRHNLSATLALLHKVNQLPEPLKMVRLSSDLLPMYTEPTWRYFWQLSDVKQFLEHNFKKIGDYAKSNNIRLSFHPGQFTVLASDNPDIVTKSIEEFEYHADMARYMGYGQSFQDFKINVHISGKRGPDGIRIVYNQLSSEAKNCITIENEEMSWGLDDCLQLADIIPIVLDVHHHWVREGEYIDSSDNRVAKVIDSWRGITPVMHYSISREDILVEHLSNIFPDRNQLISNGLNKSKLRAHSDFYWNSEVNLWVLQFLTTFDIMCESKAKNLASIQLYEQYKNCIY